MSKGPTDKQIAFANSVVRVLLSDLQDRSGFDAMWEELTGWQQGELRREWEAHVLAKLVLHDGSKP